MVNRVSTSNLDGPVCTSSRLNPFTLAVEGEYKYSKDQKGKTIRAVKNAAKDTWVDAGDIRAVCESDGALATSGGYGWRYV